MLATEPCSACYARALPPASPVAAGSRLRLGAAARGHVRCHTGGLCDILQLGLCSRLPWPRTVTGDEGPRESLTSAVPSLLLTSRFSVEPREVNFEVFCHSGDRSGPSEQATRSLRDRSLSKDMVAAPGMNSVTRFSRHAKNGGAPGRGIVRRVPGLREHRRRPERPAGAASARAARATCPARSAARAIAAVATPPPPPLYSQPRSPPSPRCSPSPSLGKEPFFGCCSQSTWRGLRLAF